MELRWDSGTEVVIRAAAKHGVNNLADGSLNRRGNRRSRAETKGPVGAGAGTSFLAPWQFGASARETNGVQQSRCCQSVMTGFLPPGSLARDSQRLSCPIRNDGQWATPTARVPPVGKIVKRRRRVVQSAPGGRPRFATCVRMTLNTTIHKRQNNYIPLCR